MYCSQDCTVIVQIAIRMITTSCCLDFENPSRNVFVREDEATPEIISCLACFRVVRAGLYGLTGDYRISLYFIAYLRC